MDAAAAEPHRRSARQVLAWAGAVACAAPFVLLMVFAIGERSPGWAVFLGATIALLLFTAARIEQRWVVGLALFLGVLFFFVGLSVAFFGGVLLLPGALMLIASACVKRTARYSGLGLTLTALITVLVIAGTVATGFTAKV